LVESGVSNGHIPDYSLDPLGVRNVFHAAIRYVPAFWSEFASEVSKLPAYDVHLSVLIKLHIKIVLFSTVDIIYSSNSEVGQNRFNPCSRTSLSLVLSISYVFEFLLFLSQKNPSLSHENSSLVLLTLLEILSIFDFFHVVIVDVSLSVK
jgi:hypothetical protein